MFPTHAQGYSEFHPWVARLRNTVLEGCSRRNRSGLVRGDVSGSWGHELSQPACPSFPQRRRFLPAQWGPHISPCLQGPQGAPPPPTGPHLGARPLTPSLLPVSHQTGFQVICTLRPPLSTLSYSSRLKSFVSETVSGQRRTWDRFLKIRAAPSPERVK